MTTDTVLEKKFRGLRRFNAIMGLLHLVQGILMIVISNDTTQALAHHPKAMDEQGARRVDDPPGVRPSNRAFGGSPAACSLI